MESKAADDAISDGEPVVPQRTTAKTREDKEGTELVKKPKKKAPPPPSGAPPKSAASALRAKTNGSPPSSPQLGSNPSVQKIRSAASQDSKQEGEAAPKPKAKKKPPPPSSAPPEAKENEEKVDTVKLEAKAKPKKKPPPPAVAPPATAPPTSAPPSEAKEKVKKPAKRPPQNVDILGNAAAIDCVKEEAPKAVPLAASLQAGSRRKSITELLNEGVENPVLKKSTTALMGELELVPKTQDVVFSSTPMSTMGKAAPISLSNRRNIDEEEVLTVTRQVKKQTEAAPAKEIMKSIQDDDDIEEIPFLEAADAKNAAKDEAKDPEIVMEKAAPRSAPMQVKEDEDAKTENQQLLPKSKTALADALYNEMKQLETMGKEDKSKVNNTEEAKEEKPVQNEAPIETDAPEVRPRKSRRSKHKASEDTKKSFEFFNPKRVPYVPNHLLDFVTRPLEGGRGQILKCFIERNRNGQNKLSPVYTLLIEVNSSSGRPIMYCRQKATSQFSSHFIFSLNKEDLFLSRAMRSKQFVGKLRSDTRKMDYALFDQGDNPEDIDSDCEIDEEIRQHIRAQLCIIRYHNVKKEHPRKMEVIIPSINDSGTGYLDWRPITRDQAMETLFTEISQKGGENVIERDKFICMHKRETQYDPLSSCIVDFRSRATCVSVKNFQMVHSQPLDQDRYREAYIQAHPSYHYDDEGTVSVPQEHVLLQMGRVGHNCFNMDFQYPLSMLQAFAICISRFDSKQR
ncbi:tubby [Thraustotheca clavata]|uniref:Tubby n=1 Tax=Thraustotheca clavata TaxID=74557 RepID=A0A1V9Y8G0_9STRA|nr:tubby [Thraustotheca clavata]